MALAKPALTSALEQLRQQLEEQENEPGPTGPPKEQKPSAFNQPIQPHEIIASSPQPLHGYLDEATGLEVQKEVQPVSSKEVDRTLSSAVPSNFIAEKPQALMLSSSSNKDAQLQANSADVEPTNLGLPPDQSSSAVPVSLHQ
jgi:hypothetical protein